MAKERKLFQFSQQFPDLEKLENDAENDPKTIEKLQQLDESRFNYINPLQNSLSQRKMFWDSRSENISRVLIIIIQLIFIIESYFFGKNIAGESILAITKQLDIQFFNDLQMPIGKTIGIIFLFFSVLNSLLYIIPMIVCRRAGSIFGWGVTYMILAVFHFIIAMIFVIMALLVITNSTNQFSSTLALHITLIFILITILIVGASILIVKSDDLKRQISVE